MRSLRSTLALILVLGALVGYIYYLNKDESAGAEKKEKAFASLKAEDIEDVQIKSADGQTSHVQKADGTWKITAPDKASVPSTARLSPAAGLFSVPVMVPASLNVRLKVPSSEPVKVPE